jgi:hypothetical protein
MNCLIDLVNGEGELVHLVVGRQLYRVPWHTRHKLQVYLVNGEGELVHVVVGRQLYRVPWHTTHKLQVYLVNGEGELVHLVVGRQLYRVPWHTTHKLQVYLVNGEGELVHLIVGRQLYRVPWHTKSKLRLLLHNRPTIRNKKERNRCPIRAERESKILAGTRTARKKGERKMRRMGINQDIYSPPPSEIDFFSPKTARSKIA